MTVHGRELGMGNINIEKLLNIYNYFDGIIITDDKARILYYTNYNTAVYNLRREDIIGKTILEIHPDMKPDESTILHVLRTGEPVYDHIEHLSTPHGDKITNICSTLPIVQGGRVVGAIDYSRGLDDGYNVKIERREIVLPTAHTNDYNLYHYGDIITASDEMQAIKTRILTIANTDSPVMISGETGTGKEMVAQSIHTAGPRVIKPFVSLNCAAIPEQLLESTLFGTVKGAFTGAENREGIFEMANGGTVFLDELNSMSLSMQAKILKVIEEKQVMRIGSHRNIKFDVKIISAMNSDPLECMNAGTIRKDLFYRLGTVQIEMPPLRKRIADIPLLTGMFIKYYNSVMNTRISDVSDDVKDLFLSYSWPGNVRELKNIIEGAFNAAGGEIIDMKSLPPYLTDNYSKEHGAILVLEDGKKLGEKIEEYEKRMIMMALERSKTASEAAERLGISKQTLNYKLLKYGLKHK